ncbi:hypothetical protein HLB23_28890 [Nocardia uniformis]|uniref:TPR repeat domain-containing protein n=1 Tax=Nocardia uniformis TaxID=53432 RepID=A0A849C521_9NOCA|nr:hypothetical protein [Nocardia uniformis]NNH73823.1 hypothetical protein [Nocardia uniformis]
MTEGPVPTVSQVVGVPGAAGWNVDLASIATKADEIAKGLQDSATTMDSTIDAMTWSGEGRNGADYRSNRERDQMNLLADQWTNLAIVSRAHQETLGGLVSTAITNVRAVRDDGFDVAEDWKVTDRYNYQKAFAAITDDSALSQSYRDTLTEMQTSRGNDATNNTVLLQRLAESLRDEDAATATDIRNTLNAIEALAPASTTELTPTAAEQDGKAIADGTATKEEIARISARLGEINLTPDQLQALERGETVNLPPGELAYLQAFYGYAGKDGLLGLSEQLSSDNSVEGRALQTRLANGLMTLSDENVVASDGAGNVLMSGGWNALPADVRDLVSNRREPGERYPEGYQRDVEQFAALVSAGDAQHQPGDRFAVEMIGLASNEATISHNTVTLWADSAASDTAMQNLMRAGSRNEDAMHALLTGTGEGLLGSDYNRNEVMAPLITHDWDDGGVALGNMFSWIGEDAKVEPGPDGSPGEPTDANKRAGQAAFGLSEILTSTESVNGKPLFETWLDMPLNGDLSAERDQSLGQVNPQAVQAMASALSPYVGNLVEMPSDLAGTAGFGDLGGPLESVRLMTVLSSDETASAIINGAGLAESMRMDEVFAGMESAGEGRPNGGEYANRLNWLVQEGINAEAGERQGDNNQRAEDATTALNRAYTAAQIAIGGFGPQQAAAMAVAEIVRPDGLEPDTANPHGTRTFPGVGDVETVYNETTFGKESFRKYTILESLTQQGVISLDSLPPEFKTKVDDNTYAFKTFTDYTKENPERSFYGETNSTDPIGAVLTNAGIDSTRLQTYLDAADKKEYTDSYTDLTRPQPPSGPRLSPAESVDQVLNDPDKAKNENNTWIPKL